MATGDIFKTKYVTWNNFGLEKQDADLTSYQLLAHLTDQLDIHEGTMFRFHQSQQDVATDSKDYIQNFELYSTISFMENATATTAIKTRIRLRSGHGYR